MLGLRDYKNFSPDRAYLISHLVRTLSLLLALFLVFYLFYHIGDGFQTKLETSFARSSSAQKSLNAEAYVFRDEAPITYQGGTVRYHYDDYEKVEANGRLATVYASTALDTRLNVFLLEALERQIDLLTEASARAQLLANAEATEREIMNAQLSLKGESDRGNYGYAVQAADSLLLQLARKELQQGKKLNYTSEIQTLKGLCDSLLLSLDESGKQSFISAGSQGGYFTRTYDGYEDIFDYDRVTGMSYNDFSSMLEKYEEKSGKGAENERVIGKIIENYKWYLVARVSRAEADEFKVNYSYDLDFPDNDNKTTSMLLERKILGDEADESQANEALLVFSCKNLPSDFSYTRRQSVTISYGTVSGLQISRSALHIVEGRPYVYTLYGAVIRMKAVDIIDRVGGYYYVSPASEGREITDGKYKGSYGGLRENDCVIVYGVNLKHGRIFK